MPVMVSPAASPPVASPVDRLTFTPSTEFAYLRTSRLPPPSISSAPVPPTILSPPPPSRLSLPPLPMMKSLPSPPSSLLARLLPIRTSLKDVPTTFSMET
jgi:hypothetical protein